MPATTARAPRVVFIHIPKTGGTTLQQVLRANARTSVRLGNVFKGGGGRVNEPDYERMVAKMDQGSFFWGHTPFAVVSYMPRRWQTHFITFLRDPVDRAISQYYGMVEQLEAPDSGGDGIPVRAATRKPGVIRGEFSREVPYDVAFADGAYISDNLQTRMLCGLARPFDEVTDEMLERAIENLGRFRCVGLTERFDESLVLLKHRIGYQSIMYDHQRVNSSRPRGADIPEDLRSAAERANRFDQELYRHAVGVFERAPELGDLDARIDLAALKTVRAGADGALPEAPPELGSAGPWWPALVAERRALLVERRAHARTRGHTELGDDDAPGAPDAPGAAVHPTVPTKPKRERNATRKPKQERRAERRRAAPAPERAGANEPKAGSARRAPRTRKLRQS